MFVQFRLVTCAKLHQRALIGKFQVTEPRKFSFKAKFAQPQKFQPSKFSGYTVTKLQYYIWDLQTETVIPKYQ